MWSLAETPEYVTNRLHLGDIRVMFRHALAVGSYAEADANRESIEIGYKGPDLRPEVEGDGFAYVRYHDWYFGEDMCAPLEVRRVGRSYAAWLKEMGIANTIPEPVAARESAYLRKFVKRSEPFTRAEAIDHLRENLGWGETGRAQAIIDALADDEITTLANERRWPEILDLIGWDGPITPEEPEEVAPVVQLNTQMGTHFFSFTNARTCIGGPRHDLIHDNRLYSFGPQDYEDTDIIASDGALFMRVWTHKSLDTPDKRSQAFGEWFSAQQEAA